MFSVLTHAVDLHAKYAIFFEEDISLLFRGMGALDWVRLERKIPIRTDQRSLNPRLTCRVDYLNKAKMSWDFAFGEWKKTAERSQKAVDGYILLGIGKENILDKA